MFIETHMHISLNGENATQFRKQLEKRDKNTEELIRKTIIAYKSRGIFAIRDGGDTLDIYDIVRRIAQEEGIIYKTPISAIYKKGYYGSLIGKPIENISDFKNLMQKMKKHNPDFIKIPLTGMMNFDVYGDTGEIAFTIEELDYIAKYAKDNDLPIMVHANSKKAIQMAIKVGVNTIEHGYYLTEEELYALKEENIIWIPTLAPLGNIIYANDKRFIKQNKIIRKIFEEQCEKIYQAHEMGVSIAVGSDSGAYRVYHGSGFFDELIYLNKAGIRKKTLIEIGERNGLMALNISKKELESARDMIIEQS